MNLEFELLYFKCFEKALYFDIENKYTTIVWSYFSSEVRSKLFSIRPPILIHFQYHDCSPLA
jgi:hypothetical protein